MKKVRCSGNKKEFLMDFIDMRPKDETDYCTFLGWMMSRKLAMTIVVVVIVLCACFLWSSKPAQLKSAHPYKTYAYNSLFLRFATGKARILGKSGYTAYIGDVDHGMVKGKGSLYDSQGNLVYEGEFDANAYNGEGKYYYKNTKLAYEGTFQDNLYSGEGKLYRESGALWYAGKFLKGQMTGEGELYNAAQEKIYAGTFQDNQILYQEMLGKSTEKASEIYLGEREIFTGDKVYSVYMKDIDAVYFGADRSNTLEEDFRISGMYVLKPDICLAGETFNKIPPLQEILGSPIYEGNTFLEAEDQIALNLCCDLSGQDVLYGKAGYQSSPIYDDVTEVRDFDKDYQAYIYVYEKEGIVYTFFCQDKNGGFDFYRMEE